MCAHTWSWKGSICAGGALCAHTCGWRGSVCTRVCHHAGTQWDRLLWEGRAGYSPCLRRGLRGAVQAVGSGSPFAPQMPLFLLGQDKTLQAPASQASEPHHQWKCDVEEPCTSHAACAGPGEGQGPARAADAKEEPQPLHVPGSASSELWLAPCSLLLLSHSRAPCRPSATGVIPLPVHPGGPARAQFVPPDGDSSWSLCAEPPHNAETKDAAVSLSSQSREWFSPFSAIFKHLYW